MPRTVEKTIFQFDELDDSAKENARTWYREGGLDYDWWDSSYEDFERVAEILGVEFDQYPVKLMGGGTRYNPSIHFSGFWSQGDGASFAGRYSYKKQAHKKIRDYAPQDSTLHAIADDLLTLQKAHGYRLEARVKQSGRYSHEYSTEIDVTDSHTGDNVGVDLEKEVTEALRDFMRWMYRQLESEYEYLTSDESVDDNIRCNEYEFDENGRRADI